MMTDIDTWVKERYRALYCDKDGNQCVPYLLGPFSKKLREELPGKSKAIKSALHSLDIELFEASVTPAIRSRVIAWVQRKHRKYPLREDGLLEDRAAAMSSLASLGIYMHPRRLESIIKQVHASEPVETPQSSQQSLTAGHEGIMRKAQTTSAPPSQDPSAQSTVVPVDQLNAMSMTQFKKWISQEYRKLASQPGFNNKDLAKSLVQLQPDKKNKMHQLVRILIPAEHTDSARDFAKTDAGEPSTDSSRRSKLPMDSEASAGLQILLKEHSWAPSSQHASTGAQISATHQDFGGVSVIEVSSVSASPRSPSPSSSISRSSSHPLESATTPVTEIDYSQIHLLRADRFATGAESTCVPADEYIKHAPLISADIIDSTEDDLLPQVGFLGTHVRGPDTANKALFLNTNIPFSAFVCGVQGSGKSHTLSCLLENALIPSRHLGRLKTPLSALVFHYAKFSPAFKISESTYLAAPHPAFPDHPAAQRITVLVSPSNPAIRKFYKNMPNVRVLPFKIKARSLDIDTMLNLMAVDGSSSQPLYLASVTKILRQMAMESNDVFNYLDFKARLSQCNFNPAQLNMLELRLGLLESFLDMDNSSQEPSFRPGEVTIMDMSCPFVDANTACVLFGIGLQIYLQSEALGKMVVLDEAHKYMLNVPGAKALNEDLLRIIRLQRHYGARVVISTQEPTYLTELIALCSIAVVHRFSSPKWFNALRKHIRVLGDNKDNHLETIENLQTGTGLVYSPNAVLGRNETGDLVRGTGRLLTVSIRKRITADGGQSVLCVR